MGMDFKLFESWDGVKMGSVTDRGKTTNYFGSSPTGGFNFEMKPIDLNFSDIKIGGWGAGAASVASIEDYLLSYSDVEEGYDELELITTSDGVVIATIDHSVDPPKV